MHFFSAAKHNVFQCLCLSDCDVVYLMCSSCHCSNWRLFRVILSNNSCSLHLLVVVAAKCGGLSWVLVCDFKVDSHSQPNHRVQMLAFVSDLFISSKNKIFLTRFTFQVKPFSDWKKRKSDGSLQLANDIFLKNNRPYTVIHETERWGYTTIHVAYWDVRGEGNVYPSLIRIFNNRG